MSKKTSKKRIIEILDNAPVIGPYEYKWPCYQCRSTEITHSAARSLRFGHVWLCRECAKEDVRDGITVFRLSFTPDTKTAASEPAE